MAEPPEVIANLAREAQLHQLSSIDGLDSKAGSLIGFAGVVLGLLFTAPPSTDHWNTVMTVGAAVLIASILPLAIAVIPRKYAFNPNVVALQEQWNEVGTNELHTAITQSINRALLSNTESLRFKALFIRVGVVLIVAGVLLASAGMLYAVNQPNGSPPKTSNSQKK